MNSINIGRRSFIASGALATAVAMSSSVALAGEEWEKLVPGKDGEPAEEQADETNEQPQEAPVEYALPEPVVPDGPAVTYLSEVPAWDFEADVVVCGCGAGGSAAAVEAADQGQQVLILERRDWCGGQLRRSGGGMAAPGSRVQQKFGIVDDADTFYDYVIARANGSVDPELVRVFCDKATETFDWVIDTLGGQPIDEWELDPDGGEMGVETYTWGPGLNIGNEPAFFTELGFEPVARCHWFNPYTDDPFLQDPDKHMFPRPGGTQLWHVMETAIQDRGIQVENGCALKRLVAIDGGNEVLGVVAEKDGQEVFVKARKAVVISTGNFSSNPAMFRNYTGWSFEPSFNGGNAEDVADDNDGTGVRAALALGCAMAFPYKSPKAPSYEGKCSMSYLGGGLKVDTRSRAVNIYGEPIPRLYIGGIACAGFIGENYPHCGCNISHSFTFGRIAAQDAATLDAWE